MELKDDYKINEMLKNFSSKCSIKGLTSFWVLFLVGSMLSFSFCRQKEVGQDSNGGGNGFAYPSWHWENPTVSGNQLRSVIVYKNSSGKKEVLTGGDSATLLRKQADEWLPITLPISENQSRRVRISAMAYNEPSGTTLVLLSDGSVMRNSGDEWEQVWIYSEGGSFSFTGIVASDVPGEFFVTAYLQIYGNINSRLYRVSQRGEQWQLDLENKKPFRSLARVGTGPSQQVYVVGDDGIIFARNHEGIWSNMNPSDAPFVAGDVIAVWGTESPYSRVFVVNANGLIFSSSDRGKTWQSEFISLSKTSTLKSIWGFDDELYIVGSNGMILKGNIFASSTKWTEEMNPGITDTLNAIYGDSSGGVIRSIYAVGESGIILKKSFLGKVGFAWTPEFYRVTHQNLKSIWQSSQGETYAVGGKGTILKRNPSGLWFQEQYENYDPESPIAESLESIAGVVIEPSKKTEIYAVGMNGLILHRQGNVNFPEWKYEGTILTTRTLESVWVGENEFVYAVGMNGIIVKKEPMAANPWSLLIELTDSTGGKFKVSEHLHAVKGFLKDLSHVVYIGGDGGLVLRFNGQFWVKEMVEDSVDVGPVLGFLGENEEHLFAYTDSRLLKRENNGSWRILGALNSGQRLHFGTQIQGMPNKFMFLGVELSDGILLETGASVFRAQTVHYPSVEIFNAVSMVQGKILMVGDGGLILHYY